MSNKGLHNETKSSENLSLEEKNNSKVSAADEENPIEAPVATEEKSKENKKNMREHLSITPKQRASVILITRNGCVAHILDSRDINIRFYGEEYRTKQIGDIIEF